MTKQELADMFGVSISTLNTNFPLFCKNQLKRGFLITRNGIGQKANFTVERVEKQDVDNDKIKKIHIGFLRRGVNICLWFISH